MIYTKNDQDFTEVEVRALHSNICFAESTFTELGYAEKIIPEPVPPTLQEQIESLKNSILWHTQRRLDDFARTRGYDGILSAVSYANDSSPKFSSEGQYCVTARSETWAALYALLAEVEAGTAPMPASFMDVILPELIWPI